jgi:hypothetical protein
MIMMIALWMESEAWSYHLLPFLVPSRLLQILYHTPDKDGVEFRRLEEALAAVCETVDAINDKVRWVDWSDERNPCWSKRLD